MNIPTHSKFIKVSLAFIILAITIMFSCAKDDDQKTEETEIEDEETEITITVEDLALNIDEHPEDGYILGTIQAETNIGTLSFSLIEQNPTDALSINETTGELRVRNSAIFDFETHPEITAIAKVTNEDVFKNATISIILNAPQTPDYHKMIDEDNLWVDNMIVDDGLSGTFFWRKLYINGEEVVNGKTYFNLHATVIDYKYYSFWFNISNNSVKEEIELYKLREEEATKKVYTLDNNNNEVLLYDFSLEVNDIIDLWNLRTNTYNTQSVDAVETIILSNGESRKKIIFESNYSIIEGIGYIDDPEFFTLSCFFKNSAILLKNDNYCEEDFWNEGNLPELDLKASYVVNQKLISISNLKGDGGNHTENNILEKGICWSNTSQVPTINDNFTNVYSNETIGLAENVVSNLNNYFTSVSQSQLQPNTLYHFRPYSKNANGVAYSAISHSLDSGFITSTLKTSLINKEVLANGNINFHLEGNLINNNFPNSAMIIEKGFAVLHQNNYDLNPQSPNGSQLTPVQAGTLDSFEHVINFTGIDFYRASYFWTYVKFDNGLIVYGNQLTVN